MDIEQLRLWADINLGEGELTPLQSDASQRRYYRLATTPSTVLMDATLDAKNEEFLASAKLLSQYGLRVPQIFKQDLKLGLFQVEDFGNDLLFNQRDNADIQGYLEQAIDNIIQIQSIPTNKILRPSHFSKEIAENELALFEKWFVNKYLELKLTVAQQNLMSGTFRLILQTLREQPQRAMHRDFHSKNLMLLPENKIGVLDFQDLMIGPITYDLVSLLKDCYITWPKSTIRVLLKRFQEKTSWDISAEKLEYYFDITGLQRHLKVLGGFSKIYLRQGNGHYLQYFDRILDYIVQVTAKYPQFDEFNRLFTAVLLPGLFEV
jgi:hypothetical protein